MRPVRESGEVEVDLAQAIGDPCFGLDRSWRITFWNPAQAALTGASETVVVGRDIFEVIPSARDTAVHAACRAVFEKGLPAQVAYTSVALVPGRRFSFGIYPHGDGIVILGRDFTEQFALEQRLREREAELEAVIAERDFLLRELHHRVANGVQALLAMQRTGSSLEEEIGVERMGRRVRAMMRVRRLLDGGAPTTPEAIEAYVRALATETLAVELAFGAPVALDLTVTVGSGSRLRAAPLGVVLSELLGDVVEREEVTRCAVALDLTGGWLCLRVADDGRPGGAVGPDSLAGLAPLVTDLGGALRLLSDTGGGRIREVRVPLQPETRSSSAANASEPSSSGTDST